jgi:DNA-3-methyladenine glycosylase
MPSAVWRSDRFEAPVPRAFFERPTTVVARALLGTEIVHRTADGDLAARIVETEAYVARDPANHADRGRTERNRSMFESPGTLYVYRIHQVYCANAVTRPGQAVLLRAGAAVSPGLANCSGPGRLCRSLGLDRSNDGISLGRSEVRILPRLGRTGPVVRSTRIGLSKAVDRPLRFALRDDRAVSAPRPWRTISGASPS